MAENIVKDVLLIGFGAVGAVYSLILQNSGKVNLTVVARSNYEAIKNEGVHFKSEKFGHINGWKPHRVVNSVEAAADRAYSHVFIAAKCVPEVLPNSKLVAPLLADDYTSRFAQPIYVLLQNGWNFERELYDRLKGLGRGEPRIVSAALYIWTNMQGANVVRHSALERIVLGMYRYEDYTTTINSPEERAVLGDLNEILTAGGSTVEVVTEIQRRKYAKNMLNINFAGYACLTRYTLMAIFRPPPSDPSQQYSPYVDPSTVNRIEEYTIPAMTSLLHELIKFARVLGFPDGPDGIPSSMVEEAMQSTREAHATPEAAHIPSTLLDIEKGRPIEVEVIWGELIRTARARGVDMPRAETIYSMLLVVQKKLLRERSAQVDHVPQL
ncbi:6-phosphogluconate dehydrogenase C-terminal domain-like protein [Schizophyllum commune H4-8]|nr:6-phosphogluconate dehydrogenase C-terminal domain-like protein [Schizophyllum commune H4-8]KAI5893527.1 6-phosphogluconate dehydrogenase C-terminal domain-like protein [Schizophyllum commune H4-8]